MKRIHEKVYGQNLMHSFKRAIVNGADPKCDIYNKLIYKELIKFVDV